MAPIPNEWEARQFFGRRHEACALSEVVDINPRFSRDELAADSLASFIPMKCVEEESGRFEPLGDREVGEISKGYTPFKDGDVLFAKVTPCMENGKAAMVQGLTNGVGFGSTEFFALRPKENLEAKYLLHFVLQSSFRREAARNMTGAVGLRRVPKSFLEQQKIPLPAIAEQRRIVAEIEKQFTRLEAGVAALRRVQSNLRRYRAAVLKAACEGAANVPLSEVCQIVSGYAFKSRDFSEEGIPVVKITNVSYGSYLDDTPSFLPNKFLAEFRRFQIQSGDILLALTRPITNNQVKTCLYPSELPTALLNQRVAKLAPTKGILRGYLLAYLRSEHFKSAVSAAMPQTLQPNLSPRDLAAMPIPLPPLAEQTRIVSEVERRLSVINELKSVVRANLQRAIRLREAILHRAFSGGLLEARRATAAA